MDLAKYVSFSGRIGRHQYWFHYIFPLYIAQFVAGAFGGAFGAVFTLPAILLMWPSLAGFAKRLHDLNLSLWHWGACIGGAIAGGVIAAVLIPTGIPAAGVIGGILLAVSVLAMLVLGFMTYFIKGTYGPNNFGPDPIVYPGVITD